MPRSGYNRGIVNQTVPALVFRICSTVVGPAWLLLMVLPRWRWSHRIATAVVPLLFTPLYVWMLLAAHAPRGAGFGSLPAVMLLFSSPAAVTAGWLHYLCFDLFTGAWQVRDALRRGIPHWMVVPCLLLTFFFGPVGLLLYLLLRLALRRTFGVDPRDAHTAL